MESAHEGKNMWLLKPTGLNRGRGIHIFRQFDELKQILVDHYDIGWFSNYQSNGQARQKTKQNEVEDNSNTENKQMNNANTSVQLEKYKCNSFVIQKYIEKPLLFKNRKFDIRVWVLISQDQRCYLFKECYVRTSCEDYDLGNENIDKIYVHLTNNAIQKYSENYGKFEDGNQISLRELADYFFTTGQSKGKSTEELKAYFELQYKQQIIYSLKAVREKLNLTRHTFEIIGYDFIVDENLQTYLIEANTNPCIEESSNLLKMYLPRMIDDMFKITIDQVFFPQSTQSYSPSQFSVNGYDDAQSMFEFIYKLA